MKHTRLVLVLLLIPLMPWLSGCSNSADDLDTQISEALKNDNALDVTERDALRVHILRKSKELSEEQRVTLITPDGKVNEAALLAYIKRNREYRKLAKIGKTPKLDESATKESQ